MERNNQNEDRKTLQRINETNGSLKKIKTLANSQSKYQNIREREDPINKLKVRREISQEIPTKQWHAHLMPALRQPQRQNQVDFCEFETAWST